MKKLALFKRVADKYDFAPNVCEEWAESCADYVRVSDWVEVEFPPLRDEAVVEKQLQALDRTETALREKFQDALNGIERQRAELRAITYVAS